MVGKEWKILNTIKDKASLMKATVSTKRALSKINKAVIRATARTSSSPPPEYRVATILNLGCETRAVARACVDSIMDRLHSTGTGNPYVALKCLIVIHHVIIKGSFVLRDQLYFLAGGQKSLKLTGGFLRPPKGNVETLELLQWVRWYANILEHNLITSRMLRNQKGRNGLTRSESFVASDLLREIESLVSMVEGICAAPESLHYQRIDLVHELMLLVSEDYRSTQRQIMLRLKEFGDSESMMDVLSSSHSSELISCLERLEACLPRLTEMFANRKRNDEFWELISQMRIKLEIMEERREEKQKMVLWKEGLTRQDGRVMGTSRVLRVCTSQRLVVGVDKVQFSGSTPLLA